MSVCGHEDCSCSTGVHEGLTFGRGELDEHGFWEIPCRPCAAASDKMQVKRRREAMRELIDQGVPLDEVAAEARRRFEWIFEPAWPYDLERN